MLSGYLRTSAAVALLFLTAARAGAGSLAPSAAARPADMAAEAAALASIRAQLPVRGQGALLGFVAQAKERGRARRGGHPDLLGH